MFSRCHDLNENQIPDACIDCAYDFIAFSVHHCLPMAFMLIGARLRRIVSLEQLVQDDTMLIASQYMLVVAILLSLPPPVSIMVQSLSARRLMT